MDDLVVRRGRQLEKVGGLALPFSRKTPSGTRTWKCTLNWSADPKRWMNTLYWSCIIGSNSVSVLLGLGDGTFAAERRFGVGVFPDAVAVGDFNGDGRPDLAVAALDVAILLNNTRSEGSP
jgi:hypothetical protein